MLHRREMRAQGGPTAMAHDGLDGPGGRTEVSMPTTVAKRKTKQSKQLIDGNGAGSGSSGGAGAGGEDRANLHEIAQTRYLNYALSVITSRALPDVRDGMKPVHRRIIYTMWQNGLRADQKHRKCATVVGDVMGRYHPHCEGAIF